MILGGGWAAASLARRLALGLLAAFVVSALCLLAVSVWVGQRALQREHESASLRMASLFEATLRNAMLLRDLDGLSMLVGQLGKLPGLRGAALLDPEGRIGFASAPELVGTIDREVVSGICLHAECGAISPPSLRWQNVADGRTLRVVYPVKNRTECSGCHGAAGERPVNGVLVLDFTPMDSERFARAHMGSRLVPASLVVLGLLVAWIGWTLRRIVLKPASDLATTLARFAAGDLGARAGMHGSDELARLGQGFDRMAAQIESQMKVLASHGEFLQSLLDAAPDAMLLIDADHRVVMANAAYERLLGLAPSAAVDRRCYTVSRGLKEPCPVTMVTCPLAHCRASAGPVRAVMAFQRADGRSVDVEIVAAPLMAADGRLQVIEIIRPVEERVRFSQEQRLSAIGLLANGVAHEIHNPLASIRLALQSSLRELRSGSANHDDLVEYLGLVDQQIDRCVHITQRLLRLSQPAADESQPVAVGPAVEDVVSLLRDEASRAGIVVAVRLEPESLRVLMDETELRQVVLNLVQNAIHAMTQGGRLSIEARRQGGRIRLRVTDTGAGIPAEKMPLIFLPFYSQRADGRRGTGLGLAICKALVEQRGGRIDATSEPGKGSRFDVDLPDADAGMESRDEV